MLFTKLIASNVIRIILDKQVVSYTTDCLNMLDQLKIKKSLFFLLNLFINTYSILKLFMPIFFLHFYRTNIYVKYFLYSLDKDQNFGRNVDD